MLHCGLPHQHRVYARAEKGRPRSRRVLSSAARSSSGGCVHQPQSQSKKSCPALDVGIPLSETCGLVDSLSGGRHIRFHRYTAAIAMSWISDGLTCGPKRLGRHNKAEKASRARTLANTPYTNSRLGLCCLGFIQPSKDNVRPISLISQKQPCGWGTGACNNSAGQFISCAVLHSSI